MQVSKFVQKQVKAISYTIVVTRHNFIHTFTEVFSARAHNSINIFMSRHKMHTVACDNIIQEPQLLRWTCA